MDSKQKSFDTAKAGQPVKDLLPESLQDALVDVFRPVIQNLDIVVEETRNSQQDVKRQIDLLGDELYQLSTLCEVSPTLEMYAKKVATIKRRVTVMHNILQNVQDRLKKLEHLASVSKATAPSVPVASADSPPPLSS